MHSEGNTSLALAEAELATSSECRWGMAQSGISSG